MKHQFSRNELAYGKEGLALLKEKTVVVLGIGGVCLLYTSPSPRD